MDGRRMATIGLALATMTGVVGCTPTADAERDASASPSPPTTSTTSPDAAPDPAVAEKLPIPVDDIADWAETAVPGSDTDGYVGSLSGWLSEPSSAHYRSQFSSLEPGTYQAQIACRGDGTISASVGDLDAEPSPQPTQCTNATIAFDIMTTSTGLKVDLDLQGEPSIFAVSVRRVG
ncbi:hypothetical protein [Microbacterium hydrocarbonoxydans]|uniref:hypothetical protein n=1 Tax=Microbacterium hydrocarbonoxydans TaxID=273678 RepID=UPI00203B57BC|nr:hypothetical protein [Microbacterium hydrocarbonoxydans]MCM3778736.1 hypothetical protein [Microbacterium hydrocarbonoxydans]